MFHIPLHLFSVLLLFSVFIQENLMKILTHNGKFEKFRNLLEVGAKKNSTRLFFLITRYVLPVIVDVVILTCGGQTPPS